MLNNKCTISGKPITGSVDSTYSAANSSQDANYRSQGGVCTYHKAVEKFRTASPHVPVKNLREFTQRILSKTLDEMYFEIISFRGEFKRSPEQMDKYISFLKA